MRNTDQPQPNTHEGKIYRKQSALLEATSQQHDGETSSTCPNDLHQWQAKAQKHISLISFNWNWFLWRFYLIKWVRFLLLNNFLFVFCLKRLMFFLILYCFPCFLYLFFAWFHMHWDWIFFYFNWKMFEYIFYFLFNEYISNINKVQFLLHYL